MSITYTYQIVRVDAEARCMEIIYSADGHQTMHIGARLPYEGEALEDIIQMYSPVQHWEAQRTPVVVPEVGLTGTIVPPPPPVQTPLPTYPPAAGDSLIETLPKITTSIL